MLPKRSTCYLTLSSIVANTFMPDDYCITYLVHGEERDLKKLCRTIKMFSKFVYKFFLFLHVYKRTHENIKQLSFIFSYAPV